MDLCDQSCSAGWLVVHPSIWLSWQKLKYWTLHVNLSTFSFIPVMLIGPIDFYHFIPLVVALMLAWGHKVS